MRLLKEVRNLTENYHVKSGMFHYFRERVPPGGGVLPQGAQGRGRTEPGRPAQRAPLPDAVADGPGRETTRRRGAGGSGGTAETRRRGRGSDFPRHPFPPGRGARGVGPYRRRDRRLPRGHAGPSRLPRSVWSRWVFACFGRAGNVEDAAEAFESARRVEDPSDQPFAPGAGSNCSNQRSGTPRAAEQFHLAFGPRRRLSEEYRREIGLALLKARRIRGLPRTIRSGPGALSPKYPDLHNFRGIASVRAGATRGGRGCAFRVSVGARSPVILSRDSTWRSLWSRSRTIERGRGRTRGILEDDPSEPAALAKLEELRSGRRCLKSDVRSAAARADEIAQSHTGLQTSDVVARTTRTTSWSNEDLATSTPLPTGWEAMRPARSPPASRSRRWPKPSRRMALTTEARDPTSLLVEAFPVKATGASASRCWPAANGAAWARRSWPCYACVMTR